MSQKLVAGQGGTTLVMVRRALAEVMAIWAGGMRTVSILGNAQGLDEVKVASIEDHQAISAVDVLRPSSKLAVAEPRKMTVSPNAAIRGSVDLHGCIY